jgi:hypothetical protein
LGQIHARYFSANRAYARIYFYVSESHSKSSSSLLLHRMRPSKDVMTDMTIAPN